jgi:hypothetical protein
LLTLSLFAVVALPLTGCDAVGTNGSDDDSNDDDTEMPELEVPEDVDASIQDDGTVELTWDDTDGADVYNVYRSPDDSIAEDASPLASEVSGTRYNDSDAQNGRAYTYAVSSVNSSGDESEWSDTERVTTPPAAPGDGRENEEWTRVKTSTDNTIHDVAVTSEGAYAVAEGGLLLKRKQDTWSTVLADGPSSNGNDLLGLAVTDDGNRLWFVGSSGALGEYDVTTGSLVEDHSAPNDVTNNFQDVAVTGPSSEAHVYVSGGSGQVHTTANNGGAWNTVTPGSGSALRALDTYDTQKAHLVDANQSVYTSTDGASTWEKVGLSDADVSLYGVDSDASDDVWVAAGSGTVYHWTGSEWTRTGIGEPDLQDLEVTDNDDGGFAVGAGGSVFAYDGSSWATETTPTSENLNAVVRATSSTPAIAVGAGGTVIER